MANRFRQHTQPTGLQQIIERVTDGNQAEEDWNLIMKICDHVGSHEESAKETMKIIRKRLQANAMGNNWPSLGLTLTLLEALAKNCGKNFHLQIAHKDFLKELKNVIGPKTNPPRYLQERVLGMIQTWALAFRHDPDLKTVDQFYQECRQQGLEFPPAESERVVRTAVPSTKTIERPLTGQRSINRPTVDVQTHGSQQTMSPEQIAKLRSELDVVQTNVQVFGEMLVTLQPGEENPQDFELLMELHNTCKQMQTRIVELLSQITIDEITVDLLRYNDEFNNSFKTFENYVQERDKRFHSKISGNKQFSSSNNGNDVPSLIRFDDEPTTITNNFQNMNIYPTLPNVQPKTTTSSTKRENQDVERDVKEVEEWLKIQGDDMVNDDSTRQEDGTTTAFKNFLQKRASTIPDEFISEENIRFNHSQPSSKPDKTYL